MRTKLDINAKELQAEIDKVEATQTFTNRNSLHDAVAATDWAFNYVPKPISSSVVRERIKEFGLVCKTPVGKRGAKPGVVIPRGEKKAISKKDNKDLIDGAPKEFHAMIQKIIDSNSRIGRIKLKCLECTNWDRKEVKLCNITSCPLHPIRPYKSTDLKQQSLLGIEE